MMLLLNNANLVSQKLPILSNMFTNGTINDFNFDWYNFNGDVIVGAMVINSVLPPMIELS